MVDMNVYAVYDFTCVLDKIPSQNLTIKDKQGELRRT